jgi:hypothetical protein
LADSAGAPAMLTISAIAASLSSFIGSFLALE